MRRYSQDPYWTRARFDSKCRKCGKVITRGQDIFYYPRDKAVYCGGDCGQVASREFAAMVADEEFYNCY